VGDLQIMFPINPSAIYGYLIAKQHLLSWSGERYLPHVIE